MKKIILLLLAKYLSLGLSAQVGVLGVRIDGGGTPSPNINIGTNPLTGFTYQVGSGPSTAQSTSVSGTNLTTPIVVPATTSYEVSLSSGSGYTSTSLSLTPSGGSVSATTIWYRLKAGLTAGTKNETSTLTSAGAVSRGLGLQGSVTSAPTGNDTILIDFGGNGTFQGGVKTPNNSAGATGVDANGRTWNNILGIGSAWQFCTNPANTAGATVTGFSIASSTSLSGTTDSSLNSAVNATAAVGIYPVTAVQDCMYIPSGRTCTFTFHIPGGRTADLKLWGTRAVTGSTRRLQFKKTTDASYTLQYDGATNTTFNNDNQTLTGLVDGDQVIITPVSPDTFGYVSLMHIVVH